MWFSRSESHDDDWRNVQPPRKQGPFSVHESRCSIWEFFHASIPFPLHPNDILKFNPNRHVHVPNGSCQWETILLAIGSFWGPELFDQVIFSGETMLSKNWSTVRICFQEWRRPHRSFPSVQHSVENHTDTLDFSSHVWLEVVLSNPLPVFVGKKHFAWEVAHDKENPPCQKQILKIELSPYGLIRFATSLEETMKETLL